MDFAEGKNPRECSIRRGNKGNKAAARRQPFICMISTWERQRSAWSLLMLVTHSRHDDIHNSCVMHDG